MSLLDVYCYAMYIYDINWHRIKLNLSIIDYPSDTDEEELFLQMYDIRTFGFNDNQYIKQLWINKNEK